KGAEEAGDAGLAGAEGEAGRVEPRRQGVSLGDPGEVGLRLGALVIAAGVRAQQTDEGTAKLTGDGRVGIAGDLIGTGRAGRGDPGGEALAVGEKVRVAVRAGA